MNGTLEI